VREVHKISPDITESVIGQAADSFGNDKQKVLEFFQENICGAEVKATFDQVVEYLRSTVPIDGVPTSFYEDCVRKANCDMSVAYDLAVQEKDRMISERRSKSKPITHTAKGPTAAPVVSPPVYNPHSAEKPKKELPPNPSQKVAPKKELPKKEEPKKEKPVHHSIGISPDEIARQNQAEFLKLKEQQEKEKQLRLQREKEREKRLKEMKARRAAESLAVEPSKEEPSKVEPELPKEEPAAEPTKEESSESDEDDSSVGDENTLIVKPPPEYMKGRLPTDLCEIKVTGVKENEKKENVITFSWKISPNAELSAKDWIALFIHDREHSNKFESYVYLDGKSEGSKSFIAPGIGFFDLRFYQNGQYEEKSRSNEFCVGPEMEVKATMQGRRKINVTWNRRIETTGDWIGLYHASTFSNAKYIQQHPVSEANSDGVIAFDAPREPGDYELRYFFSSGKHGTGYAFSGKAQIVIPNEDEMHVISTHPVVKVKWQTYSQEPNSSDWIGLYDSTDDKAKRLGWAYLSAKGLMDSVGDHGVAEIEVKDLMCLAPEATLPEDSDNWEVRLFNKSSKQPFLRVPYISKEKK